MRRVYAVTLAALGTIGLAACGPEAPDLVTPPPYDVLPVDEAMSCAAIEDSFADAARRAARLELWLQAPPGGTFGNERFHKDGLDDLHDERGRLDALSDLQRYKGCRVLDPKAIVATERARLQAYGTPAAPPRTLVRARG